MIVYSLMLLPRMPLRYLKQLATAVLVGRRREGKPAVVLFPNLHREAQAVLPLVQRARRRQRARQLATWAAVVREAQRRARAVGGELLRLRLTTHRSEGCRALH